MQKENLSLYCLKYAESTLPESMVFVGGSKEKRIPISFVLYLIQTENANILVDAGCDTLPGFEMRYFASPATVLQAVGLTADDITDVVITHSHHDHIEAVKYFTNAVIHITASEYPSGKKYIPESFKVHIFEKEYAIYPGVRFVEWGGHSKGSVVVEVEAGDKIHLLAGDECYTQENIAQKRCTGTFCNKEKATEFVKKYSAFQYCVHTCHDNALKTERII